MGRVIIDQYDCHGNIHRKSMKCKSEARAFEIQAKLPRVKQWKYYDGYVGTGLNRKNPKPEFKMPESFEELDMMMKLGMIR